jgi:F-type H+-transporting ATPase subunit a
MTMAAQGPNASEYIVHHLTHLKSATQTALVDWSVFHLDTLFWSTSLGLLAIFILSRAAAKATSGVPGRFQAAVEILVEMVESQSKSIVHGDRSFIAPLALTVFVWIFFMNAMDLLPLDLVPNIWAAIYGASGHDPHHAYMRVVPTADLNATLGMSLGVLILCLYYSVKIKGFGGWMHELFTAPFGNHPVLYPINFAMQLIEFVAKTVSHGMRLFGNMYAGELVFLLIALLGSTATWWGFGMHIVAGSIWAIFHILIVLLQAFIFMMLTLVYIGQAHEGH